MATIQIRDIPDEVYAEIVRKAKIRNLSIQQFMRAQVIDFAWAKDSLEVQYAIRENLGKNGAIANREQILEAIAEGRR
jgi:hypothetical protein